MSIIRDYVKSKEGQVFINRISERTRYFFLKDVPVEDIKSELYLLLLEKEDVYDLRYSVKTFINRCLLKRLVFIIRKKYYYYFHTDKGYEFIETETLKREHIQDTSMMENIDSKISVYEFLDSIKDKEIIIDRLNDLTLDEIGKKMNVTGENVRQRIQKINKKTNVRKFLTFP